METIEYLLQHNADADSPGLKDTVLASSFRKRTFAQSNGAKKSSEEAQETPRTLQPALICAVEEGQLPMVEFLVSHDADINATSEPKTPLYLSSERGKSRDRNPLSRLRSY